MKPLKERIINAELKCSQYLADANKANEQGDKKLAEKLYDKSQYWLDRYNKLIGNKQMSYHRECLSRLYNLELAYLGLKEFAYVLGITRQALSNRIKKNTFNIPEPHVRLKMGPIWTNQQIYRYILVYT